VGSSQSVSRKDDKSVAGPVGIVLNIHQGGSDRRHKNTIRGLHQLPRDLFSEKISSHPFRMERGC
jgi:hypothetical protein